MPRKCSAFGEARRVVKHLCPSCKESFASNEEVRAHWLAKHQAKGVAAATLMKGPAETMPTQATVEETPTKAAADTKGISNLLAESQNSEVDTMRAKARGGFYAILGRQRNGDNITGWGMFEISTGRASLNLT